MEELRTTISEFKRVKINASETLSDYYINPEGQIIGVKRKTMQLLQPKLSNTGYYQIALRDKDGVRRWYNIHRLVAFTFLKNKNHKASQVNHKDGNKLNNSVYNLEWVTQAENTNHAYESGLCDDSLKSGNLYKNGVFIRFFKMKKHAVDYIKSETGYSVDAIRKSLSGAYPVKALECYKYILL